MDIHHRIHSESTPSSLEANLAGYVVEIKAYLNGGGDESKRYYINHIGRELNTQIIRFGLEKYFEHNGGHAAIKLDNPHGGGYRPDSVNFVLAS
jgi:hypothetical protein